MAQSIKKQDFIIKTRNSVLHLKISYSQLNEMIKQGRIDPKEKIFHADMIRLTKKGIKLSIGK